VYHQQSIPAVWLTRETSAPSGQGNWQDGHPQRTFIDALDVLPDMFICIPMNITGSQNPDDRKQSPPLITYHNSQNNTKVALVVIHAHEQDERSVCTASSTTKTHSPTANHVNIVELI